MKAPANLAKLSKDEKLRLYELIQEHKRREREKRAIYKPNDGQIQVHRSSKLERYCFAANGSGKSCMLVNEVIWAAQGYNPITQSFSHVPAKIIVVLDNPQKVEDVFLREFSKWYNFDAKMIDKRGKPYPARLMFPNGSTVDFVFHLQEELFAEGLEWHWLFLDEPAPRKLFIALKRGGRSKEQLGRILFIGTPIAATWLRKEVYEPWTRGERPNTDCFRFGTKVNEANLADGYIEDFSRSLSEKERRVRLEGEFFDLDGLALAHLFKRETHVIDHIPLDSRAPCVLSCDPHPSKAHHAILLGVNANDDLFVIKELRSKTTATEFGRELIEFTKGYNIVDGICDSLGNADTTGGHGRLSFITVVNEVLRSGGARWRLRATSYDEKREEAWVAMIQEVLLMPDKPDFFGRLVPKLRVSEDCPGLISDIESVQWQKFKNIDEAKPKLDISNKDYLSCLKYALAAQPRWKMGKERVIKPAGKSPWSRKGNNGGPVEF